MTEKATRTYTFSVPVRPVVVSNGSFPVCKHDVIATFRASRVQEKHGNIMVRDQRCYIDNEIYVYM